mmetsp:Transcript_23554/g.51240  ORF Transcript_23554/g.51240 Transcript_23554/m.51240 type:complete len:173 (-) Transcript_23554:26-544(-)
MSTQPLPEYRLPPWLEEVVDSATENYIQARVANAVVTNGLKWILERVYKEYPEDNKLISEMKRISKWAATLAEAAEAGAAVPDEALESVDETADVIIQEALKTESKQNKRSHESPAAIDYASPPELESEGDSIDGETEIDVHYDSDEEHQQDRRLSASGNRGMNGSQRQEKV